MRKQFTPEQKKKREKWSKELGAVTTVSEACEMYKIAPTTLKTWILEDKVIAVRSAGVWLVSLGSLADFAGLPDHIVEQELMSTGLFV